MPALRVLLIEDNRDAADTLRMLLQLLGYDVAVAYTGPDGVRCACEWRPGVVVSDIGLPGLDGFGVARELRRNPKTRGARLIALSAYAPDAYGGRVREAGFEHYLQKPADLGALQRLLDTCGTVRCAAMGQPPAYVAHSPQGQR